MLRRAALACLALWAGVAGPGCAILGLHDAPYRPVIDPARFQPAVDHPFLPLVPGTTYRFVGRGEEGVLEDLRTVTHDRRQVLGVTCTVVHELLKVDGVLREESYDWFAQDATGTVWSFGERTREIRADGAADSTGSWEAGVDGAQPGIAMPAETRPGPAFRQEYRPGVAEDVGRVAGFGQSVQVPYGSFTGCILVRVTSPLEEEGESRWYARGVGLVRTESADGEGLQLQAVIRE